VIQRWRGKWVKSSKGAFRPSVFWGLPFLRTA
jgi:hypothetical protein